MYLVLSAGLIAGNVADDALPAQLQGIAVFPSRVVGVPLQERVGLRRACHRWR